MQNLWRRARLESEHFDRLLLLGITVVIAFALLFLAWIAIRPAHQLLFTTVDDLAQSVGILLVAPLAFRGIRSNPMSRARKWAPILLGGGALAFAVGQLIWTFYESVLQQETPFPSWADAGFLLEYPLLTLGILLLARGQSSITSRTRVLVDGLIALIGIVTFSWYFVLGPTLLQGGESAFAKIVGTAYPAWDLVLIACVFVLFTRKQDATLRPAITVLAVGLSIVVITDSLFDYLTLHNLYSTGSIIDLGWPLGQGLVCVAAGMAALAIQRASSANRAGTESASDSGSAPERPVAWRWLLPYALVPGVAALAIYTAKASANTQLEPGVYIGGTILVALLFARQVLVMHDNRGLYGRLKLAYRELGSKNRDLGEANQRLQTLATTDPLTELPNQRAMIATIDQELERGRRYGRQCALLFIDLDHFKKVNDMHGHLVGDSVLQEVSAVLRTTHRNVDALGRWGGEEFVAVLPEVDAQSAMIVADRIREGIAAHAFQSAQCSFTCSIGVAGYPDDADSRDKLIDAADRAMYGAKHLGRNQVRAASDPWVSPLEHDLDSGDTTSLARTIEGLGALIAGRAHYTSGALQNRSSLAARVALALGVSAREVATIRLAARLHDIGKIAIPDAILLKPGLLNDDEWMLMRRHPIVGADIVGHIHGLSHLAPIIRAHHERWDAMGYPDGLSGEEIPVGARILAVTDAFEAMTQGRVYRQPREPGWALSELRRCAGSQFDATVVEAIERVIAAEPQTLGGKRAS
jgi:diguanylate cyclase (GGDEF)-like protein